MASPPGGKEFPFILPTGRNMKPEEFFALRYKQLDLSEDNDEIVPSNLTRTCLNETHVDGSIRQFMTSDPEVVVRSLLENVLHVIREKYPIEIGYYEALSLSYDAEVQAAFNRSYFLRFIDLKRLKGIEQTTCFFVNLTNLLWMHGLFSFSEEFHNGLFFKNWCLRQICYNVIGYRIGSSSKFVSLYDLHSTLLNYPAILRTNTLSQFNILDDARLHSIICQPYCFSPKLTVLNPEIFEEDLTNLQNEYVRSYIIVDSEIDLLVPVPLVMQMERSVYSQKIENENNVAEAIPEKLSLLVDVLKEREFPYYDLLTKDIYMMTDTQFKIRFLYNAFDIENVPQIRKIVWKSCRFHKSLFNCLQHQASLVRSTLMDDHLPVDSLCRCDDKNVICINNVLYKMNDMYNPMLNNYKIEIDFENKGLRCLHAAVSFAVGIKRKQQRIEMAKDADHEFLLMLQIIESLYTSVSTELICDKIRTCVKIFLIANDFNERWSKWYSIFIGDPSEILSFIVDRDNYKLADEWISVVYAIEPGFTFELEEFSKYISFLCDQEDGSHLKKALSSVNGLVIADICDFIVKNYFSPSRLINLISTVMNSNSLNPTDTKRFYGLLVGLKMILVIPQCEQSFYFDVAFSPVLIVEQMILNKKITSLKYVLEECMDFVATLPEDVRRLEAVSRDRMDDMFREYAAKALHFRKKPAATDCLNAALLHAEIFKEGNFYPPDQVPPTNMWIPNNWVPKCMCCKKTEFNVFVRRHHCRRCGRVVCDACSSKRMRVATYKGIVRVCEQCFDFESQYEYNDDSVSENSSATDDSFKKTCWKLSTDNDMNSLIRQQAAFDSAPDIELCLSILELHSESIAVPRMLFSNAESLIKILRQRLVCPANFDYSEISNIVKSLLLAAKLYYTHLSETQGTRRCEELDSEVDILNQLSKIKLFPSDPSKPLRDIQELKKIRDTVLERQKWELALEISTKIGLECHSIWYLWGNSLLKSGEYASARDKISKSNIKKNSALVNDVLEILFSNAEKDTTRSFTLFKLNSAKNTSSLPDPIMEECIHYLTNYGTPQQQFDFYTKYDRLIDAITVTFEKKIPPKQFVDKVFAPCLKQNDYATVLKSMKNLDNSLKQWDDYINEISIYCKRNDLFKELYEIQLWAKDFYRAAISCTLFFTTGATTYAQLMKREENLVTAILHLKSSIDEAKGKKLEMITKQLTCLRMQLEVTQMIGSNNITANLKFTPQIPTLFGREEDKIVIVGLIFDSQKDFKVAFNYTEKLIVEFSLNVLRVYTKLTEYFMSKNQEKNVIILIEQIQEAKPDCKEVIDGVACAALKKGANPDSFLEFISNVVLKIEMAIAVNRLKTAYILAIPLNKLEYLERILEECKTQNMTHLLNICSRKVAEMKASSQNV